MQKQKPPRIVMIATPILDPHVSTFHCDGLLALVHNPPPNTLFCRRVTHPRDITRGRSRLVRQFLELPETTHLLYLDADTVPNPAAMKGMMAAGLDIVACPYPRREIHAELIPGDPRSRSRYSYFPQPGAKVDPRTRCIEIRGIGFGFILIRRHVLETMVEKYAEELQFLDDCEGMNNAPTTAIFDHYWTPGAKMLGEDLSFCARAIESGFKVHMYLGEGAPADHIGVHRFQGDVRHLLPADSTTEDVIKVLEPVEDSDGDS